MLPLPLSTQLTTERLLLRAPSRKDFPHIFSATRYAGFNDGMLWEPPTTIDELEVPLANGLQAWEEGIGYGFAFERKTDGQFLGRISIRQEREENVWSIGFWTHPSQQGQGYMQEAVQAILQLGFERLGAQRIEACHACWNKASERVLQKRGFRFLRYIEQGFQKQGVWVAENLLGVGRDDWKTGGLNDFLHSHGPR